MNMARKAMRLTTRNIKTEYSQPGSFSSLTWKGRQTPEKMQNHENPFENFLRTICNVIDVNMLLHCKTSLDLITSSPKKSITKIRNSEHWYESEKCAHGPSYRCNNFSVPHTNVHKV